MKWMLSPLDYVIWVSIVFVYPCVSLLTIRNREFVKYLALNVYVLGSMGVTVGEWLVYVRYGYASGEYSYFYYYAESFLSVLLYTVVWGFYAELMESLGAGRWLRMATLLMLVATVLAAFSVVETHRDHMTSRFVVGLGRDLNFVGGLLTYVLLLALAKTSAPSRRWLQLVSALGVYFFGLAMTYGIRMFHPEWRLLRILVPLSSLWIALAWAYSFATVPATERSVAVPVTSPQAG